MPPLFLHAHTSHVCYIFENRPRGRLKMAFSCVHQLVIENKIFGTLLEVHPRLVLGNGARYEQTDLTALSGMPNNGHPPKMAAIRCALLSNEFFIQMANLV